MTSCCATNSDEDASRSSVILHVGTAYNDVDSSSSSPAQEILTLSLCRATGTLSVAAPPVSTKTIGRNPGWFSRYHQGRVYVCLGDTPGKLQAFRYENENDNDLDLGRLEAIGNPVSSVGRDPVYCQLDVTGRWLFAANYTEGSVCVVPVRPDGSLGRATDSKHHHQGGDSNSIRPELCDRQEGPHAHCILPHPSNRWVVACDLGLSTVFVYAFDPTMGCLVGAADDPRHLRLDDDAGPRHCCWDATGTTLFISNELNCTVTAASFDVETGTLNEVSTVFVLRTGCVDTPDRSHHRGGSDIGLHPNGRFLYVGCRSTSPGMLAILEVQQGAGADVDATSTTTSASTTLKLLGHESSRGEVPRNFKLLRDGNWLVVGNQETKTVVCYRVDNESGRLSFASEIDTDPYKPCNIASKDAIFA